VEFHRAAVRGARTPEAQLAATFDRFRAAASHYNLDGAAAAARVLIERATTLHELSADQELAARSLDALKRAHGPLAKLRAAFAWYRAEAGTLRRIYGDDPEFSALLAADMHEVAVYLNGQAVALEQAAEPGRAA
jgi:hypothetical protein